VPPMMAESAKAPFDSPHWIFEIKLDGYQAITVFDDAGKPHLWSLNGLPLEQKFSAIAKAVAKLKLRWIKRGRFTRPTRSQGVPRCRSDYYPSSLRGLSDIRQILLAKQLLLIHRRRGHRFWRLKAQLLSRLR